MLASIHPLGERARRSRWWLTTSAYLVASAAGGAGLGVLAGGCGRAIRVLLGRGVAPGPSPQLLIAACVGAAVLERRTMARRLPSWHRQVSEDWLSRYRGWVYGAGYGLQLGFGVVTIVSTAAVYAWVVVVVATGSMGFGAALGATFGLARSLPVLAAGRVRRPEQLGRLHAWLAGAAEPARTWTTSALMLAAVAVVAGTR